MVGKSIVKKNYTIGLSAEQNRRFLGLRILSTFRDGRNVG